MRAPSPENRVFMGAVMAVAGAHPEGTVVVPNVEGSLQVPQAKVAAETRAQAAHRLAWEQRFSEAVQGRRALAERYTSCAITGLIDLRTSQYLKGVEHVPRNEVIVTVAASIKPEAAAVEAKYDHGQPRSSDVVWHTFNYGAVASTQRRHLGTGAKVPLPIPTESDSTEAGSNQEVFTVTLYPRIDDPMRTTNAAIMLRTHVENPLEGGRPGLDDDTTYRSTGSFMCGQLVETEDIDGQHQWELAPGPDATFGAHTITDELCEHVPRSDDGVMYDKQCS